MPFTDDQKASLSAKLDGSSVKKNPKGFDYVEGWWAIAEANRIFGFDGWDRQLMSLELVGDPYQVGDKWRVAYRATVRITVRANGTTITRDGTGYGSGIGKDLNDAHESASKESETDAMKRGLMTFGNPFGLALYDKAQENVEREAPAPRQQPRAVDTPPKPAGFDSGPIRATSAKEWASIYRQRIDEAPTLEDLNRLVRSNGETLLRLSHDDPDAYEALAHAIEGQRGFFASHPTGEKKVA